MIRRLLVGSIGMPIVGRLIGWPVSAKLRELNRSQWWPEDWLRALQSEKLVRLVRHAYETVPFYRQLFDAHGISPSEIRGLDDYSKLPILSKQIIRANYPDGVISSAFDRTRLTEEATSGSTGEPFKLVMSPEEKAYKWASLFRYWAWAGWHPGDRSVILAAKPIGALKSRGVGAAVEERLSGMLQLSTRLIDRELAVRYVKRIRDFRPVMIRGYASSLHHLAETALQEGMEVHVKSACTTGSTLFDNQREAIEKAFHCRVFDAYGGDSAEIAGQCDQGSYHINAENCLVEIVDENGVPVPPGVMGQVVITDLNAYSMPFIRYNLQDVAEWSDERCGCSRSLPLLKRIYGRLTDVGITPSGRVIISHTFSVLLTRFADAVTGWQVTQEKADEFVLTLVRGPAFDIRKADLDRELREIVGPDVLLRYVFVDVIPAIPGGKRRVFVSKSGMKAAGLPENEFQQKSEEG